MSIRTSELAVLKYALDKLENFIGASRDDPAATCTSFKLMPGREEFTEEQKRAVRIYLESWVLEPLEIAIKAIEGDRSYTNEETLKMWSR